MSIVAGWYPDPNSPTTSQRYWDGAAWTDHTASLTTPPEPVGSYGAPPQRTPPRMEPLTAQRLETLTKVAGRAKVALLFGIFFAFVIFGSIAALIPLAMAEGSSTVTGVETVGNPALFITLGVAIFLATVGYLIVFLYYQLMWQYKAAEFSRDLGVHAKFTPALGTFSWLIPYASYVMPFLAILDMLPERHDSRKAVVRWWIAFGASAVLGMFFFFAAIYSLSLIPLALILVGLFVAQEIFARQSITAITEFQKETYFRLNDN
jgi:hypothetical protein